MLIARQRKWLRIGQRPDTGRLYPFCWTPKHGVLDESSSSSSPSSLSSSSNSSSSSSNSSSSISAGFVPTDLASLKWWLTGDTISGADDDLIDTWPDQEASFDFAALLLLRPTLKTNIINGHAVARFNGTANEMAGSADAPCVNGVGNSTIFMAAKLGDNGNRWIYGEDSDIGSVYGMRYNNDTAQFIRQTSAGVYSIATSSTLSAGWHTLIGVYDTTGGLSLYVDGVLNGTDTGTGTAGVLIGAYVGGFSTVSFFDSDIEEVGACTSALAGDDLTNLIAYLAGKVL